MNKRTRKNDYYYNGKEGYTKVTKAFKNGAIYTAESKVHPEDMKAHYNSQQFGRDLADLRIQKQKLRDELNEKIAYRKHIQTFVNHLLNYKTYDPKTPEAKVVFRQLNMADKEIKQIKQDLALLDHIITKMCTDGNSLDDILFTLERDIDRQEV